MKRLSIFALLLLLSFSSQAQTPNIQWQISLGGSAYDHSNAVVQTADSGFIVAGTTNSVDGDVTGNHGYYDCWLVKLSSLGAIQWQKALGGTGEDVARSIIRTFDSGYILIGYTGSNDGDVTGNHGAWDAWVVKLDATGTIQWQKALGGSGDEIGYSIQQTTDSGYIIAGLSISNDGDVSGNHGSYDAWVAKLTSTGTITWQKSLGGTASDRAMSVQQTMDNCYIVGGYATSNDGDVTGNHGLEDFWVVKLSSTGSILWQKALGGSGTDVGNYIRQTSDSGYVIVGYSSSNTGDVTGNHGGFDYWVAKLSSTGVLQWQKSLAGSSFDHATSVEQMQDSTYIVAGYSLSADGDVSASHGGFEYWILKLSTTGAIVWEKSLGGTGADGAYPYCVDLHRTTDAGYIVTGQSSSNDGDVSGNHGNYDYWVVKLDCGFDAGIITGASTVCIGSAISLSDTASGGVWSVSNANAVIVGGVVTGVTAGSVTITYGLSTACGYAETTFPLTVISCPTEVHTVNSNTISIVPNPTTGYLSVTGAGNVTIKVYNTIGQLVNQAYNTDTISIADASAGLYFVQVLNEYGQVIRQEKIIKQ